MSRTKLSAAIALSIGALATPSHGATVYLCKPYKEGSWFWSALPCSQQQATTQGNYEVPPASTWEEKVAHAERLRQAPSTQVRSVPLVEIPSGPIPGSQGECASLRERIKELQQAERQVNPPMPLSTISQTLSLHRERWSFLRCR